jgi:hypothetical protein
MCVYRNPICTVDVSIKSSQVKVVLALMYYLLTS